MAEQEFTVTSGMLSAAITALARKNVSPDIQMLLLSGNDRENCPPGALKAAISAAILQAFAVRKPEET